MECSVREEFRGLDSEHLRQASKRAAANLGLTRKIEIHDCIGEQVKTDKNVNEGNQLDLRLQYLTKQFQHYFLNMHATQNK